MENPLENILDMFLPRYSKILLSRDRDGAVKKEEKPVKMNFVKNQARQNKLPSQAFLLGLKDYM